VNRLRGDDPSASHPQEEHGLSIPPELLPTLSILRSHITTLTRDNEALRCTFLGRPCIADPLDTLGEAGKPKVDGVNLEDVLIRVRELVRENEELGDMVLHAGHADVDALEQALNGESACSSKEHCSCHRFASCHTVSRVREPWSHCRSWSDRAVQI
jgi:hypothetical protein